MTNKDNHRHVEIPMREFNAQPEQEDVQHLINDVLEPQSFLYSHNFSEFKKHHKSTKYCTDIPSSSVLSRFRKSPTVIFDSVDGEQSQFDKILESSSDNSFKFISFTLKHFKIWNNEEFLEKHGERAIRKFASLPEQHLDRPKIKNFFSFLMYDWFDPQPGQTYSLSTKAEQFDFEGKSLFEELFNIVDDAAYSSYKHVVLRILYQYLYETDKDFDLRSPECFECIDQLLGLILIVKNQEFKMLALQVIAIFWLISCTDEITLKHFKVNIKKHLNEDDNQRRNTEALLRITEQTSEFLDLCFLLKGTDHSFLDFQVKFNMYLDKSKDYYGDFLHIGINHNVQLLSFLAKKENPHSTVNFIFQKFPSIGTNATIMTSFEDVRAFTSFKVDIFESSKLEKLHSQLDESSDLDDSSFNDLEKFLITVDENQTCFNSELNCLIFGRTLSTQNFQPKSVFERILATPGTRRLIRLIWNKFDLTSKGEILSLKNCNGKYLLEFVLHSKDDENLLTFLIPKVKDSCFTTPKVNLKVQNHLFISIKGKSIFEHFVEVCRDCKNMKEPDDILVIPLRFRFYTILFSLLEEHFKIQDINRDIPIDKLIKWASKVEIVSPNDQMNEDQGNIEIRSNCQEIEPQHDVQNVLERNEQYDDVLKEIDDLLGNIVAYWTSEDKNYEENKSKLLGKGQLAPFFEILFAIIENEPLETFVKKFLDNLKKVEVICIKRYLKSDLKDKKLREDFLWVILLTAILNDQKKIIDYVLTNESIPSMALKFPINMRTNESTNHFALKMLENGYEIGMKNLPPQWITAEKFKTFLDSKLTFNKKNLIEVDCKFLLHSLTTKYQIKCENDVDQKLLLWEDTHSLKYILKDESLKDFLTHPTIATYIDLKMHKFQSIYWWNFWIFALLIIVPFGSLVTAYFQSWGLSATVPISFFCGFSIIMMVGREVFQVLLLDKSWPKYFRKLSNILEMILILAAIVTIVVIHLEDSVVVTKFFAVATMLMFTFDLLATLRTASMPFYFIMLKKVAKTFIKFFLAFMFVLVAFTISFWVFFGVEIVTNKVKESHYIDDMSDTSDTTSKDEDRGDVFDNFLSLPTAFMKIVLMLSGEYTIEPFTLTGPELIFFFIFVITTFILFNLILGLTIDDVQKLKKDARGITLRQNARSIIETSKFSFKLYKKLYHYNKKENRHFKFINYVLDLTNKILSGRLTNYFLLHKIDKLYINVSTMEVTFNVNRKQQNALTTNSRVIKFISYVCGRFVNQNFVMKSDAFDYCKKQLNISVSDKN